MPQSDYEVTIDIVRPHRTKTSGGYTETLPPDGGTYIATGVTATQHFYARQSLVSVENQGDKAGGAPGQASVTDVFFKIDPQTNVSGEVKVGDRVYVGGAPSGTQYRVKLPERRYARTLQIDTERVR